MCRSRACQSIDCQCNCRAAGWPRGHGLGDCWRALLPGTSRDAVHLKQIEGQVYVQLWPSLDGVVPVKLFIYGSMNQFSLNQTRVNP